MLYCTAKQVENWFRLCSRNGQKSDENFSNFDPMWAFALERSEGENQSKPKSKQTNENNRAEEDGSNLPWSKAKILTAIRTVRCQ